MFQCDRFCIEGLIHHIHNPEQVHQVQSAFIEDSKEVEIVHIRLVQVVLKHKIPARELNHGDNESLKVSFLYKIICCIWHKEFYFRKKGNRLKVCNTAAAAAVVKTSAF